jgi:hypothetical protein
MSLWMRVVWAENTTGFVRESLRHLGAVTRGQDEAVGQATWTDEARKQPRLLRHSSTQRVPNDVIAAASRPAPSISLGPSRRWPVLNLYSTKRYGATTKMRSAVLFSYFGMYIRKVLSNEPRHNGQYHRVDDEPTKVREQPSHKHKWPHGMMARSAGWV